MNSRAVAQVAVAVLACLAARAALAAPIGFTVNCDQAAPCTGEQQTSDFRVTWSFSNNPDPLISGDFNLTI